MLNTTYYIFICKNYDENVKEKKTNQTDETKLVHVNVLWFDLEGKATEYC